MQTRLLMIQYDDITGGYQGSNYTEYSALLHITIIYITIYTIVRLSSSPLLQFSDGLVCIAD